MQQNECLLEASNLILSLTSYMELSLHFDAVICYLRWLRIEVRYFILNWFWSFCTFLSGGNANRVQCSINVNYQSLAGDELVLLQDKLLDPKTLLHSMTSANGRDRNLF